MTKEEKAKELIEIFGKKNAFIVVNEVTKALESEMFELNDNGRTCSINLKHRENWAELEKEIKKY